MIIAQRLFDTLKTSAAAAALLGLAACSAKAAEAPAASALAISPVEPPAKSLAATSVSATAAADPTTKLNVYIKCYNATNERARSAMQRYALWVKDLKVGPTGKERAIYGTYTLGENFLENCDKPVTEAAGKQPALPDLDSAAKAYSQTVLLWGKALKDSSKYYSRDNYKDDAMAQGKAMHADFMKNYEAFEIASKAFGSALDAENGKRQLAELAQVEKAEGRKLSYWHMSTMVAAKQLVNVIEKDSFDMDAASAKLKAYEDAMGGLSKYAKQPGAGEPAAYTLNRELESLLVTAKQRIRRVRDNTPYSTGEKIDLSGGGAWMVKGSPARLIKDYNSLVKSSSRAH